MRAVAAALDEPARGDELEAAGRMNPCPGGLRYDDFQSLRFG